MNSFTRHRASSMHPNPHVHAVWWRNKLEDYRYRIKYMESPTKRYMMGYRTKSQYILHEQMQQVGKTQTSREDTSRPGSASRSRPGSAQPNKGLSQSDPASNRGPVKRTRPQSARSASAGARGGNNKKWPLNDSGNNSAPRNWEPFAQTLDSHASTSDGGILSKQQNFKKPTFPKPPSELRTSDSNISKATLDDVKLHSCEMMISALKKVEGSLEDLDSVENNLGVAPKTFGKQKKRVQTIKLQLAKLHKELDDVQEELFQGK